MTESDLWHEAPPAYGGSGQPSPLLEYLRKIERALKRGGATEHTHRPALKELLEALDETMVATNEPKRSQCGAPDYVVSRQRDHLTLGHVDSIDVGKDLDREERGDQMARYLPSLSNLLLTDYLEFRWFVDGKKRETFRLATLQPAASSPLSPLRKWNGLRICCSTSSPSARWTSPPPRNSPAA